VKISSLFGASYCRPGKLVLTVTLYTVYKGLHPVFQVRHSDVIKDQRHHRDPGSTLGQASAIPDAFLISMMNHHVLLLSDFIRHGTEPENPLSWLNNAGLKIRAVQNISDQ